ncbi:MBL fold metallo-hydrolase RNA specificity domain-containing protein [Evtepia sp.]|uniref:MBL fold metallo-hydrolase RNA specificity domain-containing protein n=1 Tax=Evtepia sp. TaxID=2773933 RepID=UPI003F13A673
MKLTFFGAAKAVTGSCHCLEVSGKKILIDCGLQQGRDERDNAVLDFNASDIDYVIVTHAHIDHSGRIPLLVKQGFHGQIFTTRLTGELLSVMLQDSAHIQEMDAQWKNQKGKRAGREPVEPLYTVAEATQAMAQVVTFEYGQIIDLFPGVKIRFVDAGHLLGSASVEVWATENGVEKKIVFSGDLGNINQPVIRDPSFVQGADYVVMESTYGDRNHEPVASYTAELAKIIDDTFSKGGNVIIPSFAVGRTQELLYFMREMKRDGMVKSNPDFTVVVDSPLANVATKIFSGDLRGYLDEEAIELVRDGEKLFTFPGLTMTESGEESKMLNMDKRSKVIISASGMCDAGRIRHHLKHNLWREECAIVFVGYQGEGTLGRHLLNGAKQVRLFGEDIAVNATIHNFKGLSSHADRDHLLDWIDHVKDPAPQQVFVVHGDAQVTEIFANTLREKGIPAHAPLYEEVYDLAAGKMLAAGVELAPKKFSYESSGHVSAAYHDLESAAMDIMTLIRASKGSPNKDLKKMANQLRAVVERWQS